MKQTITWSLVILTGVFLFFIWLGFLFPNPNMSSWNTWNTEKIIYLCLPRIFIPLLYSVILFLIFTRDRKLAQNIGVLLSTLSICSLIAVPIIYISKTGGRNKKIIEQYHPYLQLKPKDSDTLNFLDGKRAIKIFCLGGSTTEFKDSKKVGWTERLQKELRKYYNSDSIFIFNFGRQWYNSLHTLINYETNLRYHKPDVIIVMDNINDFIQNADFSYLSLGKFRQDYGHFIGPVVDIINSKNTGLLGRTRIKFRNMWYYNIPPRTIIEQDSFPGLEPFTRNLNTLIDLASLDSTKIILLTQPNIYSENMDKELHKVCVTVNYEGAGKDKMWGYRTGYMGMNQYNERIKEISEKRKTYFIDLEKFVPKSLIYFKDEVHYTDISFDIVSKSLAKEIIRLKVISPSNK
jgi:hypothetical protein